MSYNPKDSEHFNRMSDKHKLDTMQKRLSALANPDGPCDETKTFHFNRKIGHTKRLRSIDCGLVEHVAMAPEQGIGGHIDGETDHGRLETGIGMMLVFHGIDQGRGESPAPKDESADFGMVSGDQFEFEFTGRNPGSAQRSG